MTARPSRLSSALLPLERLLRQVDASLRARGEVPDTHRLRRVWLRNLLRGSARLLLQDIHLPVPQQARLFQEDPGEQVRLEAAELSAGVQALSALCADGAEGPAPETLGRHFETLLKLEVTASSAGPCLRSGAARKRTGSYYTPPSLTAEVASRAIAALATRELGRLRVCDPACGAGAFLLEVARKLLTERRELAQRAGMAFAEESERRLLVQQVLYGVDLDPLAIEVAELALWMFAADPELAPGAAGRLHSGDALTGRGFAERDRLADDAAAFDWQAAFPDVRALGFDLVIGNPPWVAFAGRAAQPLKPSRRSFFSRAYAAFRGYPTLHSLFVERAVELAPRGIVALVVPSPIADLDGYRATRKAVTERHAVCEPLLEFGQDAFDAVTQPCFALVATPVAGDLSHGSERCFRLAERARQGHAARSVEQPRAFERLAGLERLPKAAFREMGLQTTRLVTEKLLLRGSQAEAGHTYPLLEGREVREYRVGPPRLFLRPDAELLRAARCRLRPEADYREVGFVVRQTARFPIAALHSGFPFRNTLLAGFGSAELSAELLVGLLNSSLYRALHLAAQRDARQAVFPQVKLMHLRALPRPPRDASSFAARIGVLVKGAHDNGSTPEQRLRLDELVFAWFGLGAPERDEVLAFLHERAPELATLAPAPTAAVDAEQAPLE